MKDKKYADDGGMEWTGDFSRKTMLMAFGVPKKASVFLADKNLGEAFSDALMDFGKRAVQGALERLAREFEGEPRRRGNKNEKAVAEQGAKLVRDFAARERRSDSAPATAKPRKAAKAARRRKR